MRWVKAQDAGDPPEDLLALHEALERFARHDPLKGKLVEPRFFGGLTLEQVAACLDISPSTADRAWRYARAWLYAAMAGADPGENGSGLTSFEPPRRILGREECGTSPRMR
jgi:hypothetical protein